MGFTTSADEDLTLWAWLSSPDPQTSAIYARTEPEYFAGLDSVWKGAPEPDAGVYAVVKDLNEDGDEFRQEDLRPKRAAEIGAWFRF